MIQRQKMVYTTPWMECMQIETEGFCAASVVEEAKDTNKIEAQAQSYDEIDCSEFGNVEWK